MKVLYLHQHFSTPQGATGNRSYQNAIRLLQRGHSVTMVCGSYRNGKTGLTGPFRRGKRSGRVDGIDVIELELDYSNYHGFVRRSFVFLNFAIRSLWIALREDCDVIFATSTPLTAAIPGIFARVLRRKPFVFEVRDLWPELPRAMGVITNPLVLSLMGALEFLAYRTADRCIGLSPGIVEGIKRRAGPGKHVAMIPNGCDLDFFTGDVSIASTVQRSPDLSLLAAFTGAHGQANGLDAILDAAAELNRRNRSDIAIWLVGDGKLKPQLRERAAAESIDNIMFHDSLPKSDLRALMRNVDVGLMVLADVPAFYFGTSPNKFFDYIAQGLPVINNYPGWLAGMIESSRIGIVVPPGSATAFADALENLADNPDERQSMGLRAREFAERNFDREQLSEEWVSEVEKAFQQRRASVSL